MKFNKEIKIENKIIAEDSAVYIIAEAGVNHGGDMNIAKKLIDIAVSAGADAVKFQTFRAEHLILENVDKAPYQKHTTDNKESQFKMLKSLEVSTAQNFELKRYCLEKGITFLTTPFDEKSLEELDELNLPAYKIASTDTTNIPFLVEVAKKGKPIFLSTGMSYMAEVEMAVEAIHKYNKDLILLQCTANYPIEDHEANLNVINTFKENFNAIIGYSDHSVGVGAAPFAVPMGAKVIEKHFTLDKSLEGPDHLASLSPEELSDFVKTIRRVETYLGTSKKYPSYSETKTRKSLQKCFVARKPIKAGETFSMDNLVAKRTGGEGISPFYLKELSLRRSSKNYEINDIIIERF